MAVSSCVWDYACVWDYESRGVARSRALGEGGVAVAALRNANVVIVPTRCHDGAAFVSKDRTGALHLYPRVSGRILLRTEEDLGEGEFAKRGWGAEIARVYNRNDRGDPMSHFPDDVQLWRLDHPAVLVSVAAVVAAAVLLWRRS